MNKDFVSSVASAAADAGHCVASFATDAGWVSVEASGAGVRSLRLKSAPAADSPGGRFPEEWREAIVGVIERPRLWWPRALSIPLDLEGTPFQRRVWRALRAIPTGRTRTYGQIAAEIGQGAVARVVGSACGANPVLLLIPCHRAVGADGSLTGFRGGLELKRDLLRREGAPGFDGAGLFAGGDAT